MDLLARLVTFFTDNGYLAVFMALLICGAGVPLPEDVTLVAGGVMAGLGYANLWLMLGVTMTGVLIGDIGMFVLGRYFGARVLEWRAVSWVLTPSRYAKVQKQFERYGNRMLFAARFLPGMRTAVFMSAGLTHRVPFLRFLLLDGAAALISVPFWVGLGFVGADAHRRLLTWVHRGQSVLWIVLGIVVTAAITLFVLRLRGRKRSTSG